MDEHGKNMYVLGHEERYLIFEAGLLTPSQEMLGIKKVIPDVNWLIENASRIDGVLLSQANQNTLGCLPYMVERGIRLPIFASSTVRLAALTILRDHGATMEIKVVEPNHPFTLGAFTITPFRTVSAFPLTLGYHVAIGEMTMLYLKDYMLSNDRNAAFHADPRELISLIATKPIDFLAIGANFAENPGFTAPHHRMMSFLDHSFRDLFLDLVKLNVVTSEGLIIIDRSQAESSADAIILITGHQDTVYHYVSRIATGYEEWLKPREGDLFIAAAPPAKGNETQGTDCLDEMARSDIRIINLPVSVLSLKGSAEDMKYLISMVGAPHIVPHSGLYKDLIEFTKAVKETAGSSKIKVHHLYNGDALYLDKTNASIKNSDVLLREQYINDSGLAEVGSVVLQERDQMSNDGVAIVAVGISRTTKLPVTTIDIQLRGVIFMDDDAMGQFEKIHQGLLQVFVEHAELQKAGKFDIKELRHNIKKRASKLIERAYQKKPVVLPAIVEIRYLTPLTVIFLLALTIPILVGIAVFAKPFEYYVRFFNLIFRHHSKKKAEPGESKAPTPAPFSPIPLSPEKPVIFPNVGQGVTSDSPLPHPSAFSENKFFSPEAIISEKESSQPSPPITSFPISDPIIPTEPLGAIFPEHQETTPSPNSIYLNYELPSVALLDEPVPSQATEFNEQRIAAKAALVIETLKLHGMNVKVNNQVVGPRVSKLEIELEEGRRVSEFTRLEDDLKLALAVRHIRIEAPVPGKSMVGIEIPNEKVGMISQRTLLSRISPNAPALT
ncbi:unnamed protein product [Didymodactylos carnosus]|uniref:Metallo-beta-lactamase domain-containing protein n=1 Tax=Didymodactylos carnosus TaxID=1234261 RepID=A0A8S2CQY3_9BILA|nr:unnamed protein product [Didymodactylos carnosus]CAF3492058.1 unnamed protein product [Didymodactylos carnosus]